MFIFGHLLVVAISVAIFCGISYLGWYVIFKKHDAPTPVEIVKDIVNKIGKK